MDRLNQLRAGGEERRAGDAALDSSSPPSEAYMSANDSSSKYFSLSDSSFDISPIKDVSLASAASASETDHTLTDPDELLSNLSPITKKDVMLDSFKIDKHIEAANILSGVDIFDDNENSFDGDELVIDDNVDLDDKTIDDKSVLEEAVSEGTLVETHLGVASKDTEVVLQIDGKNVDAIDIGNGLYLYRKAGQDELAAVQIITEDEQQEPSFKFLKVRENVEGNLEVYEEFEIEVSKDPPVNEAKPLTKKTPNVPKNINTVNSESSTNKVEIKDKTPSEEVSTSKVVEETEVTELESRTELNLNGKMMKFNESRKSPVVGTFTPMTYSSTPNKEGKPLTKTMVDQQLHPNRHSDNVKKTIEVHTDSQKKLADEINKQKPESQIKTKLNDDITTKEIPTINKQIEHTENQDIKSLRKDNISTTSDTRKTVPEELQSVAMVTTQDTKMKLDNKILINAVNPTNAIIDDKSQVKEAGPSKTFEVEVKDMDKNKKRDKASEIEDSLVKTIQDIAPRINDLSNSNTVEISDIILDKHSTSSNKASNKVVKSTESETCKVDQELKKSKENEQKVEVIFDRKVQNSTLNEKEEKAKLNVTQKESTEVIDDVSRNLTSFEQTNKTKDKPQVDAKELIEKAKTLAVSNIPTAIKLVTTSKQIKDIDTEKLKESKPITAFDKEKSHQLAKKTDSTIAVNVDKIAQEDDPTKPAVEKETENPKATIQTKKIDQVKNKIDGMDKINPFPKGVETKTDSKSEKLNLVVEPFEEPISLKTEIHLVSKSETKAPLTAETRELHKKIEAKTVSQTNKFIPVAKGVEPKALHKPALMNPTEKKIESVAASKTTKIIPEAKTNEPKTYSKTEKAKQIPKTKEVMASLKPELIIPATKSFELKTVSKTVLLNPVPKGVEPKMLKIAKGTPVTQQIPRNNAVIITSNKIYTPSTVDSLANVEIKFPDVSTNADQKPINNNHTAVPFGKWTDANRQEFLNKFKEIKVPATSTSKQIKNSNDLNRIDVLKKIDSQRSNTSAKTQDKSNAKDTVFSSKIAQPKVETKIPVKNEGLKMKAKPADTKSSAKPENASETVSSTVTSNADASNVAAPEIEETREVNVNDLIGRAIVDMLNRPVAMPMTRSPLDEPRHVDNKDVHVTQTEVNTDSHDLDIDEQKLKADQQKLNIEQQKIKEDQQKLNSDQQKVKIDQQKLKTDQRKLNSDQQKLNIEQKIDEDSSGSLDDIEMKMNELHGIPFVERPPHELPRVHKTYGKSSKDKHNNGAKELLPATSKQTTSTRESVIDLESDEEVIEHEPITGDIDLSKNLTSIIPLPTAAHASKVKETQKKDSVITEKDFDKFARRNSVTYENCLTVKFDGKPGNVVQTVKEKDAVKICPKNDVSQMEGMAKLPQKQISGQSHANKIANTKFAKTLEDPNSKNYQSKIHTAYQSVLTAKRQMDHPITIIEDKPVKVVFMDANDGFVPNQLDIQGKDLSPAKKPESTKVSPQAIRSNVTDVNESKQHDDVKAKAKHQRKQVLTPVEAPDLELIQPRDLGLDVSPKKKRKTDDSKTEKCLKTVVHKKSYLLGRAATVDKSVQEVIIPEKEAINHVETVTERTVSAIDSLVKAAELLDNQSVDSASPNPDSLQNTPIKRGRGRPRKYPLPDEAAPYSKAISPSPQKKPRLIDAKPVKRDPITDEESSDDEQMIRENWTMGKINENIVCPICNKLFRSENVVFKHVKHCTGVSPTRSDLEKRSPRRRRYSTESGNKSFDSQSDHMEFDEKPKESSKSTPNKEKSKDAVGKLNEVEVIVIEDTPVKDTEKKSIGSTRSAKEQSKHIPELTNETTDETQEKAQKVVQEKLQNVAQEKPQKVVEEKSVKEKTLKDIAEEKISKAKMTEELPKEKTAKVKNLVKTSVQRSNNLVCEFCGKTFRQLSYLATHKLQHQKEQLKKLEAKLTTKLQAFSCEVCNKEFRKMHHLVQHKIIHNPEAPTRTTRKSSSEQCDIKVKELAASKQKDDTSAGFRCEPCDKSFRKLHHLVEHRETHDGINRQKTNAQTVAPMIEKPPPPPQCDVCKKSFRKLHHLIEHKEQHLMVEQVEQVETSSEKSDDKSVQSSMSTRDIIHECSLCYMVFPNEHSLNKHFVFCQQKKKRQSKAKDKPKNVDGVDIEESTNIEDCVDVDNAPKIVTELIVDDKDESETAVPEKIEKKRVSDKPMDLVKTSETVTCMAVSEEQKEVKEFKSESDNPIVASTPVENKVVLAPEKTKKVEEQQIKVLPKKTPVKDRVPPSVTRRQKSFAPLPILPESKPVESSDDDEVRYMLNPNFKTDVTSEGKVFMQVRSNKRNSLQIERPNSKDLMSRRTSLQHPPKIPRLKAKAVEPKVVPTVTKNVPKPLKLEAASTDSDDSDVKYSFPATVTEQAQEMPKEKKIPRKSLAEKRKSLGGIAKRKSLGQAISKLKVNPSPVRIIKRRTLGVEHRCDCGQLFNSAALLTRHTSLAHTPPRIRRRRSPPPEPAVGHSSAKSEPPISRSTRKSSVKSDPSNKSIKPEQSQDQKSSAKPKRSAAHRGVPVPEKMRRMMMKLAK